MASATEKGFSGFILPGVVEPSYGLYPGVAFFSDEYDAEDYREWVEQSNGDPVPAPVAMYIQDAANGHTSSVYTDESSFLPSRLIRRELRLQGELFDADRPLQQLICSGSIVTAWSDDQLYRLVSGIQESFSIRPDGLSSWCACLGAVIPSEARLRLLRVLGFNHIRLILMDRHSPIAAGAAGKTLTDAQSIIRKARELGIRNVVVDLPYREQSGADRATGLETFLTEAMPDRIRLVEISSPEGALSEAKKAQRGRYKHYLSSAGYQDIGLGWFVRTEDPWWQAQTAGCLHWSLLGFTELPRPDVVGIGLGAVSSVGDFYGQTALEWDSYQTLLEQDNLPVVRGIELEADDVLRREIMVMILAGSLIQVQAIEEKWGIRFDQFFESEINQLHRYEETGWIARRDGQIDILVRDSYELSRLCNLFDRRSRAVHSQTTPVCT